MREGYPADSFYSILFLAFPLAAISIIYSDFRSGSLKPQRAYFMTFIIIYALIQQMHKIKFNSHRHTDSPILFEFSECIQFWFNVIPNVAKPLPMPVTIFSLEQMMAKICINCI